MFWVRLDLDSGNNFIFSGGGGWGVLCKIPEQGCFGEIWSKFSGSLAGWCITDSLSHTTYVKTNKQIDKLYKKHLTSAPVSFHIDLNNE